jgi:hypothetical protein
MNSLAGYRQNSLGSGTRTVVDWIGNGKSGSIASASLSIFHFLEISMSLFQVSAYTFAMGIWGD